MCKLNFISQRSPFRNGCKGVNLAVAVLLGLTSLGHAQVHCPLPDTPCPCAADGMCYPRRETWGNYKTQWRAWPGESVGLTPTRADGAAPDLGDQLPTYVRPRIDQEDLRGPAKPLRPTAPPAEGGAAPAPNGAAPAQPAEAAPAEGGEIAPPPVDGLELPGFGPQGSLQPGSLQPLPQLEDGPPALPKSLSQAMISQFNTPVTLQRPTVAANPGSSSRPLVNAVPTSSHYVTPAAAIDTSQIELANPAAKNVQNSKDEELHQAIYFEASDIPQGR